MKMVRIISIRMRLAVAAALLVAGVVIPPAVETVGAARVVPLTRGDLRWLERVTFGIDNATVAAYRRLGREKFLDEQLHPPAGDPGDLATEVAALSVSQQSAEARVRHMRAE